MFAALAAAALLHPFLIRKKPRPPASPPPLKPRHERSQAAIVGHEPRASFPADPLHC
jgi:hypothetical protein